MKIRFLPPDYEQILFQQNQKNMRKNQTVAGFTENRINAAKTEENHMKKLFNDYPQRNIEARKQSQIDSAPGTKMKKMS